MDMGLDRGRRGDGANREVWDVDDDDASIQHASTEVAQTRRRWTRRLITWFEGPSGEAALHDLADVLGRSTDPEAIGQALTASARRVIGSDAVELVPDERPPALGDLETAIALRYGGTTWGWLVVSAPVALTAVGRRRLETLGAMAATALARLDADPRGGDGASPAVAARRTDDLAEKAAEETELGYYPSAPAVHDATFLNAVFPFALSQAKRYGESLSVLCVAVDRLSGIRELLGPDQVDRTIEHTGRKIATLIRASDIVARLDDDRLMVLLPRAELDAGLIVARKLCQGVADNGGLLSDAPMLTLSIGVASYPACATSLYELLDASDAALSEAQGRGRNRTASAPTLSFERAPRREGALA
jgi:diguanylate cyclase (GGDEF)-like protein